MFSKKNVGSYFSPPIMTNHYVKYKKIVTDDALKF